MNIQYTKPTAVKRGLAPLDPNHTHFIFVDDGTRAKFGGEISFRARLEHVLAGGVDTLDPPNDPADSSSSKSDVPSGRFGSTNSSPDLSFRLDEVPVVLLVFEGGPNTVRTGEEKRRRRDEKIDSPFAVHEAVFHHRIPAVILEGTGRCCDLFSKAIRLYKEFQQNFDRSQQNEK